MASSSLSPWCVALLVSAACAPANVDVLTDVDIPLIPQNTTTKFLHWGGGQPAGDDELTWFVANLPEVERAPFDGTVLDLGVGPSWLDSPLGEADLASAVERLRTANFQQFTDNFQLLGMGPVDFADDDAWSLIAQNLRLLGALGQRAGLRGFMLDTQQYAEYFWSYARLPAEKGSFTEEEQRYFLRGEQLMQALLDGFPDLTLLLTLGSSEVFREVCIAGSPLEGSDYALLPAFLDGMQAARDQARSAAVLLDAFLPAYPTLQPAAFRLYHDLIHGDWDAMQEHWLPGVVSYRWATGATDQSLGESAWPATPALACSEADRSHLTRDVAASFAVMLDYPNRALGSDVFQTEPARFGENTRQPGDYTALLRSALAASDRYVWSWTSNLLWWPKPGDVRPLVPQQYVDAAVLAREQARQRSP